MVFVHDTTFVFPQLSHGVKCIFPGRIDFPILPIFSPGTTVFSPRLSQGQITTSPVEYTHHIACSVRACAFASMCQVCVCSLFKYIARSVTWRLCLLRRQTTLEPSPAARGRGPFGAKCLGLGSGRQAQMLGFRFWLASANVRV